MKEQLIEFKTAKLAREIGFAPTPLEVASAYANENVLCTHYNEVIGTIYPASTQSVLQKWLREIHDMYVNVHIAGNFSSGSYEIYYRNSLVTEETDCSGGYENALEKGLQEALCLLSKLKTKRETNEA